MNFLRKELLVFSVVFVSLIVEKCFAVGCPPVEDIYPCRCEHGAENHLACYNITSTDQFAAILRKSRSYGINRLTIERSILEYIPKEAFNDERLYSVRVAYNVLDRLWDESPQNSDVRFLVIKKNQLKEGWNWRSLSTLTQLESLSLTAVPLDGDLDLSNISRKLNYLSIYKCRVRNLQDNAFQDFVDLVHLLIFRDSISTLKRSMFPKPAKLQTLSFTDTEISELPEDLFQDMPDLKYIDFMNNQLTVLSENTFRPVLRAQMSFRGNLLTCDCSMEWILNGSRNHIFGGCNSPEELYGRELSSLSEEDFGTC